MNLPEAAERFIAAFGNGYEASVIAPSLTARQAEAMAALHVVMGEPEIAEQWLGHCPALKYTREV